jgi:hypothetical protein
MPIAPIAVVVDLKAAFMLARNQNLGVAIAKLYLSNRPARGVNLAQDDGESSLSATSASALFSLIG